MVVNVTKPVTQTQESVLSTNRVLQNTYALLAATLLFSAVMAVISMAVAPPPMVSMVMMFGALGVIWFVLPKYENSAGGVGVVFLFTGMLGFALGPILNMYAAMPNGSSVIATAMGGTGTIFLGLSAYVLKTKKSFDFMIGFLGIGILVAFCAGIANIFLQITGLQVLVSSAFILLMSGMILWQTGQIINGGETNYINATTTLFLSIFNMFTSLLQILGIMGDE